MKPSTKMRNATRSRAFVSCIFVWVRGSCVPLLLCVLAACILTENGIAQTVNTPPKLTQPYIMREDFQGDSLGQWASYPPAQDVGYEPSLAPTSKYDAPGGRSLMRVVKPNIPGPLRFGFIKRIQIVVSNDASLRFAYRVNATGTSASIETGLAGTNGTLYTKTTTVQVDRWSQSESKLSEFRDSKGNAPPVGLHVEAVYLTALLNETNPDTTYRFIIDDLSIKAERESQFLVTTPATEVIDPWRVRISEQSYRAGDKIALETSAPARLSQVNFILKRSDGSIAASEKLYDDGTHGDRRSADGIWSNNNVYSISAADRPGLWKVEMVGSTSSGSMSAEVRLLVHPPAIQVNGVHPRLFFSAADRAKLVERSRDPKLASLWANVQTTAKNTRATGELAHGGKVFEVLDSEYLLPSLLAYFDVLNRARSRIAHNAFEAYLTDSAEARAAAKSAMLAVANWKRWQPPWFNAQGQHTYYPAGLLAADVALGYDLLYDHLTESERAQIRTALIEKSIIPTYKEYVLDNRVLTNTSNWIAHTVGGALIAAAAIAGDVDRSKGPSDKFEIYVHGLLLKLEDHMAASYLADGSYGEGISYHEFDMETLGPALNAVRRSFGIDYWKQTHVLESFRYPLYTLAQPTSGSLDMGDTHAPAGHGIPAQIYESKDPVARWYFSQFDRPSLSKFIFYDDSVAPVTPRLPTSRIFEEKGNAVFRSSWNKDAIIFLYRAGPNFNHHHADQGSFLLNAFGENLVTEAGWSDYYKDPYYATFFTQAVGHNTVLVDGNPESQSIADTPQFKALDRYPRITDSITSEFYDGLSSDLAAVYQNRLERYQRRIVFVKPYYFVVFDDLRANGKSAQFDFLLHLPDRDKLKVEGLTATYRGASSALAARSFAPAGARLTVEKGRIPYHVLSARTPAETPAEPAYLVFRTANPTNETQFLTALVPSKTEGAAQSLIKQMSEIVGGNVKGIRVDRGNEKDLVIFRSGDGRQSIREGEWATDAATLSVTLSANTLKMFAVQNGRSLRRGDQTLFSSASPASIALNFSAAEVDVVCNLPSAARISLYVGKKPVRILLDGKEISANAFSFNSTDGTISLEMPGGQHELKIMFR
ncbi:MAG TPA: heparinase II/III family protein [Pyrinomonadaceae bacterium]|nr:heparinase II/III family protein [Pyrinomonadaceae bacterium]